MVFPLNHHFGGTSGDTLHFDREKVWVDSPGAIFRGDSCEAPIPRWMKKQIDRCQKLMFFWEDWDGHDDPKILQVQESAIPPAGKYVLFLCSALIFLVNPRSFSKNISPSKIHKYNIPKIPKVLVSISPVLNRRTLW